MQYYYTALSYIANISLPYDALCILVDQLYIYIFSRVSRAEMKRVFSETANYILALRAGNQVLQPRQAGGHV